MENLLTILTVIGAPRLPVTPGLANSYGCFMLEKWPTSTGDWKPQRWLWGGEEVPLVTSQYIFLLIPCIKHSQLRLNEKILKRYVKGWFFQGNNRSSLLKVDVLISWEAQTPCKECFRINGRKLVKQNIPLMCLFWESICLNSRNAIYIA